MVKVGNIYTDGVTIYLIDKVLDDGSVVAQICSGSPASFSPIAGASVTLSPEKLELYKKIGKVND